MIDEDGAHIIIQMVVKFDFSIQKSNNYPTNNMCINNTGGRSCSPGIARFYGGR